MIATIGPCLPHDLIRASGQEVNVLSVDIDRKIDRASGIFENKFAPWCAGIVENWMVGAYDRYDTVIFSRGDDTVQRLYYYVCELQRRGMMAGPAPYLFDVSMIQRDSSEVRQLREVRALAAQLSVDDNSLKQAIRTANQERAARGNSQAVNACLLAGTPLPDDRLHKAIERGGCIAVGETLHDLWSNLGPLIDEGAPDPALALAKQVRERAGARSFRDPGAAMFERIEAARPVCGILWLSEDDEATGWQVPALRAPFEDAGIPLLVLTNRDPKMADGVENEIEQFAREHSE